MRAEPLSCFTKVDPKNTARLGGFLSGARRVLSSNSADSGAAEARLSSNFDPRKTSSPSPDISLTRNYFTYSDKPFAHIQVATRRTRQRFVRGLSRERLLAEEAVIELTPAYMRQVCMAACLPKTDIDLRIILLSRLLRAAFAYECCLTSSLALVVRLLAHVLFLGLLFRLPIDT